jgi:hypothetical protein
MTSAVLPATSRPATRRSVPSAWINRRPQVSGEQFPQHVDLSPSRLGAMIICAAGLVLLWSMRDFVDPIVEQQDPVIFAVALVFPVIGVGLVATGLVQMYRRQLVTFRESGVEVSERNLTGSRRWSASYSDYAGVLQREHTVSTRYSTTTYQIIQLLHADPAFDLPLYVARGGAFPRQRWEALAKRLRLPALQFDDDRVTARPVKSLDDSLEEQIRAGRVTGGDGPYDPPPRAIRIKDDFSTGSEALLIELRRGRLPLTGYALFAVFMLAFMVTGYGGPGQWPMVAFAAGLLAAITWVRWKDSTSPRAIRLSHDAIESIDAWRWNTADAVTLGIAEIEGVRVHRSGTAGSLVVAIESDRGTMHLGQGLSRAELNWLRDFLITQIALRDRRRR